jgi:putative ABC transport system permease protein
MRLTGLAVRLLLDAPLKSLGTLVGVVVSVFLMLQQLSLLLGILARVAAFADATDVDLWVTSPATESSDATDSLPASRVAAAAGTPGVAWAAPVVQGLGRVTGPGGVRELVKVVGVEAPRYAGLPRRLAPGTSREALRGSGRLLLDAGDRARLGVAAGDRLEVDGRRGVVAGFFAGLDPHSPYAFVFANLDDARALTGFPPDRVTFVAVGLAAGADAGAVKQALSARLPDVRVFTRQEWHDAEIAYFTGRNPVGLVFGMGTVVAALIGAGIVAVTLYSTVVDRTRDYGLLKAVGAVRRDLLRLLFTQAALFALVGYALGAGAFFLVRHLAPDLPMVAPHEIVVGVALAALGSCALASLAAMRRVLTVDPAIVFKA